MVTSPDYIHVGEKLSDIGNRVLYMRFPLKVPPLEKIKELHPGIINVRYPRQKSARFCHVIFASKEIADQARKQLNRQKYAEKGHLVVRSMKKLKGAGIGLSATKEDVTECKRLWIGQLPADTTTEQVCANFPGCTWSKLFKKSRGKKNLCSAVCVFSSHKEASAILNNPDAHKINDIPIVVQCAKHLTSGQKIKEDGSNTNQMRERTKKNKIKEKINPGQL